MTPLEVSEVLQELAGTLALARRTRRGDQVWMMTRDRDGLVETLLVLARELGRP